MKQKIKDLNLGGKDYRIAKMTPRDAVYWATKLLGKVASSAGAGGFNIAQAISGFLDMPPAEFRTMQDTFLGLVSIKYDAGWSHLLDSDGNIVNVDATGPEIMALTVHSFMHSLSDFLDPALLADSLGALGFQTPTEPIG